MMLLVTLKDHAFRDLGQGNSFACRQIVNINAEQITVFFAMLLHSQEQKI